MGFSSKGRGGGGPVRPVFDHDGGFGAKPDYKTAALCKQVRRSVALTLAGECADELLQGLIVDDVLPAPNAGRLLVRVISRTVDPSVTVVAVLERLQKVHGLLRARVGEAIVRKRTPELTFDVVVLHPPCRRECMMNCASIEMWLSGPLPEGVELMVERLRRTEGVTQVAVMPDVHLASEFCVGTVVASEGMVFPQAVGGDIGCGMLALPFDVEADALADETVAARLLGLLSVACPGRRHHRKVAPPFSEELLQMTLSDSRLEAIKRGEESRMHLGTLGAGNHFLELQADESQQLWLMIHTGSRNLGQQVLQYHLPKAMRLASGIMALDIGSLAGQAYLNDVAVARAWARENRRCLAQAAAKVLGQLLGAKPVAPPVDCDHNHVQLESAGDREMWVHRKGATAAQENVPGIIPGSMGTRSFHTIGRGEARSLNSSSHGAGRALSRTQARDRVTASALRRQLRGVWYDARLERELREEAPAAYKDIDAVMAAKEGLTRVVRRLRPMLIHKGV